MGNLTTIWNSLDFRIVLLLAPTIFAIASSILLDRKNLRELIFMAIMSISIASIYAMYTGMGNTGSLAGEIIFSAKLLSGIWFIITIFILVLAWVSSGKSQRTGGLKEEKNGKM